MKSLASVLSFRPSRLPEARARIVKLHPATRSSPRVLAQAEIDALRARVIEAVDASDPARALKTLAHELLEIELVAVVRSIGLWSDLRAAVTVIAQERPSPKYFPALWRSWQAFPASDSITALLKTVVERFGPDHAIADTYGDDVTGWFRGERPIDSIVRWAGTHKIASEGLPVIPESPFKADTPLIRRIFHRTLQIGSRDQLLEMEEDTLIGGWEQMSGDARMEACANYLERVPPADWPGRERVLEEVKDTYGMPLKTGSAPTVSGVLNSIVGFWKRISEERREEFREYLIRLHLEHAFEGDSTPDRRRFWMDQRRDIVTIAHGVAGETEFCVIAFSGFSVFEFFEVGNAAYLYPNDHSLVQHWLRPGTLLEAWYPSQLKALTYEFRPPGGNRIIHRDGWQSRARETLWDWSEHYP